MTAVLELDEPIQAVVATLANIVELKPEQEQCTHQGQIHCFLTAKGVWEKVNISACTISGEVGSIAIQ